MKRLCVYLTLCLTLLATLGHGAEKLVWRDEFNFPSLNKKFWTPEVNFVRNVEAAQIYTDRPKNLSIKRGALTLTAYEEYFENKNWKPKSKLWTENRKAANYTSGSVNSRGKIEFRYGRVEIRARIEHGRGVWPALWLIGNNPGGWPACGEIDILEFVSQNPNTIHATLHYKKNGAYTHPTNPYNAKKPVAGDWHLYGMNWTPEKIELLFDNQVIFTKRLDEVTSSNGTNPFRAGTFFFILNLALDGWAEAPVGKDYPRSFMIDYIRLYQDDTIEGTLFHVNGQPVATAKKSSSKALKRPPQKKARTAPSKRKKRPTRKK